MVSSTEAVKAEFAGFEIDFSSGELTRNGQRMRLQGQPFLVLRVLLDRAGEVVTREELQRQLWPDETFVDFDHGLNKAIGKLREALEDPKSDSKLIETLPRRGYRFTADVNWVGAHVDLPAPLEARAASRSNPTRSWLFGGLAVVVLLVAALGLNLRAFGRHPLVHSIAVLPLVNLSNDPEQEYFADGMTDQLITNLSYAKSLRVVSRASTIAFKKSSLPLPQIAEQLHVDAVIEGTVLRTNNTIRTSIRLIGVKPERQLWAASYERNASDAVTLQKEIAAEAVTQVRAQFTPEERSRLDMESRINPEAYDEYLRARFFLHRETGQKGKAIPHLERAIQLDSSFAAAYAALGEAWAMEAIYGGGGEGGGNNQRELYAKALEYSQKAVSLDPASSEAYSSLGLSLMQNHRWNEAEVAFRRALELDANNPYAADYFSLLLAQKGRSEESVRVGRELAQANPIVIDFQRVYAIVLYEARRYDEAITECDRLIELDPNHTAIYGVYTTSLVEKGRFQDAETALHHSQLGTSPGVQAWLYARQGNDAAARQVLKENASSPINAFTAVAYYILGEQERGLAQLDYLANEAWANKTYFLRSDPVFDPMRRDPRFTAIVKKTGLLDN